MSDYKIDMEAFGAKNMSAYHDSFNLAIGTANTDIDLFNNEYIEFKVNEMT